MCRGCADAEYAMTNHAHQKAIEKYGPDALFKIGLEQFRKEFGS